MAKLNGNNNKIVSNISEIMVGSYGYPRWSFSSFGLYHIFYDILSKEISVIKQEFQKDENGERKNVYSEYGSSIPAWYTDTVKSFISWLEDVIKDKKTDNEKIERAGKYFLEGV